MRVKPSNASTPRLTTPNTHVIIALATNLERDVISRAMKLLRPDWKIDHLSPEELEPQILDHRADVVICTAIMPAIELNAPMWIVLSPASTKPSIVSIDGHRTEYSCLSLAALLDLIDQRTTA